MGSDSCSILVRFFLLKQRVCARTTGSMAPLSSTALSVRMVYAFLKELLQRSVKSQGVLNLIKAQHDAPTDVANEPYRTSLRPLRS